MDKDCELRFSDNTPPYQFRARDLDLALKTASERGWKLLSIKTPWYTLSVFDHETYDAAMDAFTYSGLPQQSQPKVDDPFA